MCVCVFDLPSEPDYKTMTNVKAAQSLGTCGRLLQHRSIFTRPAKEPNHGVEGLDSMEAARLAPVPARCMGQIGDCRLAKLPSAHHGIDHAAECPRQHSSVRVCGRAVLLHYTISVSRIFGGLGLERSLPVTPTLEPQKTPRNTQNGFMSSHCRPQQMQTHTF